MPPSLPLFKVRMPPESVLLPALARVLYSGQIGEGEAVAQFESAFGQWLGHGTPVACSSGTAALHLALLLAGIGPGDEVLSTAMTAEPTNMAIRHAGGLIRWADVDPQCGNVTAATLAAALTPATKALLVVDYAGLPVDMAAIRSLADAHGLRVIEDAAHALGARFGGKGIGADADFTIFSFQAIKHITTGDGGMLVLRDPGHLSRARRLRWFGLTRGVARTEVAATEVGYKYNMNNIAATMGLAQMEGVDQAVAAHRANGQAFDAAFSGRAGLAPARLEAGAEPSYWLYTLLCDDPAAIVARLEAAGVASGVVHRRNDLHPVFAAARRPLPGLDRFSARHIHLPCGWWVGEAERARIIEAVTGS
ncbi:MAG: DegT/DnrJ/EryC1/StrS family aminotransferase [Magnetospirillum sp.]|nr:DegT/DnrJ/EryC1/StrS family aminotransferase [Magnetospirillum sp.]